MAAERAHQKKIRKMVKVITTLVVAVPLLVIIIIAVGSLIMPLLGKDKDLK
jgi:uncharacterized membrane protein